MNFIQWILVVEDILITIVMLAFLSLRKNVYILVVLINICVLIFVNILVFQGNKNEYLLMLPIITIIFTSIGLQAYYPQKPTPWRPQASKIILFSFVTVIIILICISILLAQKLL